MDVIKPQPGAQELFLSSPADIIFYGGSAGGGKSWAILLEPLRHVMTNNEFYAVIFRRNTVQIRNPGGLWDESLKLYSLIKTTSPIQTILEWKFKGGGRVKFAHLENEKTVYDWQGAQIPLIMFDELTHFTESQFFYMLSRNRSMCGVHPYVRGTCNPDADSWVASFIEWWLDGAGYAIPERSGVIRWFVRIKEQILWADSKEECIKLHGKPELSDNDPKQIKPKSFTFIRASLDDNPALTEADPNYQSNLEALPIVEQMRLLGGNWKIKYDSGLEIFAESSLLVDGQPVDYPVNCSTVFAVIDSAMKDGLEHDGTAVTFYSYDTIRGRIPLIILDWDIIQIEGSLLEIWIPSVLNRLEELAIECGALRGVGNVWVEDKSSGIMLLQQCKRKGLNAMPIPSEFSAISKSERAIAVSGDVLHGKVKFSKYAYNKTKTFKAAAAKKGAPRNESTKNHLLTQVTGFRIGVDNKTDDLLDTFTYGLLLTAEKKAKKK